MSKPVLDVVTQAAVVHYVVELDGRVISARRYEVVDSRGGVQWCRRTIGQKIQIWRGSVCPGGLFDEVDGPVRKGQQIVALGEVTDFIPQFGTP